MKLRYYLLQNFLLSGVKAFMARIKGSPVFTKEDVFNRMNKRGTTLTKTDMIAGAQLFFDECEKIIREGGRLNFGFLRTEFIITGNFDSQTEHFDKKKHKLKLIAIFSKEIDAIVDEIDLTKVDAPTNLPNILEVLDMSTNSVNDLISSEGVVYIYGYSMKVDGDNPENRIILKNMAGVEFTITQIIENLPKRIIVKLPKLPDDEYYLSITTQSIKGQLSKQSRTGIFRKVLRVV